MTPILRFLHEEPETPAWEAIFVTAMAGLSTILGGLSLFLVKRFKPIPFAMILGLSGGVMAYVTLVQLVPAAIKKCASGLVELEELKEVQREESRVYALGWLLGTFMLFFGWFIAWAISFLLDCILHKFKLQGKVRFDGEGKLVKKSAGSPSQRATVSSLESSTRSDDEGSAIMDRKVADDLGCLDLVDRSELMQFYDEEMEWDGVKALAHVKQMEGGFTGFMIGLKGSLGPAEYASMRLASASFQQDQSNFLKIGIFTAIALGIHNIPEGMATYTSYIADKHFGYGMAFAIAVHNVPEGVAVAVPAYFGTGSWIKALGLCAISSLAEPFGAVCAMGIKSVNDSIIADGILLALVSGFMMRVSISEMFYTGFKYDPTNVIIVTAMITGMAVMSFSMAIFEFTGHSHQH